MEAGTPDRSRTATDPYNFIEFCSFQHHQGSHNLCGTGGCPALVFIFAYKTLPLVASTRMAVSAVLSALCSYPEIDQRRNSLWRV